MRQPWLRLIVLSLMLLLGGSGHLADAAFFQQDPFEPNNTGTTATEITLPFSSDSLNIASGNDVDIFSFVIESPGLIVIDVDANSIDSPLDSILDLFNDEGDLIDSNDDFDGFDPRIETLLGSGQYFVRVRGFSSSSVGNYKLSIRGQDSGNCIENELASGASELWRLGQFKIGTQIQVLLFGPAGSDFDLLLHEVTSQNPLLTVIVDRGVSLGSREVVNYQVQSSSPKEYIAVVRALSGEAGGKYTLCWSTEP